MNGIPKPPVLDVVIAGVFLVISQSEVWLGTSISPRPAAALLEATAAIAVGWRRASPLVAAALVVGCGMAEAAIGVNMRAPAIPMTTAVVMAYAIIAYAPLRKAIVGTLIITLGSSGEVLLAGQGIGPLTFVWAFVALAWALGRIVRIRASDAARAELAVERLRLEQEDHARRAAAAERTRIGRELHDVIAHSVSVMVVQASAAQQVMGTSPASAAHALEAVQEAGRQAIGELGLLLGVLHDAGELGLSPQPTIAQIDKLVRDATVPGLSVGLEIIGERRALPAGVELTIYRIVQEALTNTRKHADRASEAHVTLEYDADGVTVHVRDNGIPRRGAGTGKGLIGMRERVNAYGGELDTGAVSEGGFSVRARIPVRST